MAGDLMLDWVDSATDGQPTLNFTLRVVAIDLAGNESAPQTVRINDDRAGARVRPGRATTRSPPWLAGVRGGSLALRSPVAALTCDARAAVRVYREPTQDPRGIQGYPCRHEGG